ncbi:MAG: 4'-phosphopantetheinyl transferase superfamily protein [Burkholderiales bacterium]|nr:4'-phosphopantetheinyl transferase superfamily protein [Burkholderiales bacterium]
MSPSQQERAFAWSFDRLAGDCPWPEIRARCDAALAKNTAFVLIMRGSDARADPSLLSDADRERAGRFVRDRDRNNLVLGRTLLHHLVRPQGAPGPCELRRGTHGKPFIPGVPDFNVSHSADYVACAVSPYGSVGLDVEASLDASEIASLLRTVAHPEERRVIGSAEESKQVLLFMRCWTRKEALLKATGVGLIDKLDTLDTKLSECQPLLTAPFNFRLVDLHEDKIGIPGALALSIDIHGADVCFADLREYHSRSTC